VQFVENEKEKEMTPTTVSTSSEAPASQGQWIKFDRRLEDAIERAKKLSRQNVCPTVDGMQKILEGDELMKAVVDAIIQTTKRLSVSNQYPNEEVSSNFGYLSGYKGSKPMAEQVAILRKLFDGIDLGTYDESLASQQVDDTEGSFAIPDWHLFGSTYGEAVQKVLDALKKLYGGKFHNYRENQLDPKYLRQQARTVAKFEELAALQTGHKTLIVFGQFGIRHRGRSVRRARECMSFMEFSLGVFSVGIMLLTHPERLQQYDDLWIDCAGDEYSPDADGAFDYAPYVVFDDGRLEFRTYWFSGAREYCGSASGLLPKLLSKITRHSFLRSVFGSSSS
jgi:hypothetical protein